MKISIKPADTIFSLLIRERDGWRCQRCKTQYTPPTNGLQCSHFWGRGNKSVRFDPRNCDALCHGCHSLWEGNKQGDYMQFKKKQLGEAEYQALEKRARSTISFGALEFKQMAKFLREIQKSLLSTQTRSGFKSLIQYVEALR